MAASPRHDQLPRLPAALLHALLPRAERDEVVADIAAEYRARAAESGPSPARRWLWRQALGSAPALLHWSWWRGWTGFEPRANAYRPGGPMLKTWISDARYAARRLRARTSYTVLAVLTLALGIGGTAAIYGIARGLLFDPLPYGNEREVGVFYFPYSWTEEEFLYLRGNKAFPGFRQVASYMGGDMTLRSADAPARLLPGLSTSWELFDVLGARPLLGRRFHEGEDLPGAEPVAIISYGLWKELGGSTSFVGQRLTLDGEPRTVIGVMPRGFWFPDPSVRIWTPAALSQQGRSGNYTFIGRTMPGQDVASMGAPMQQFVKIVGARFQYPAKWDKTKDPKITPVREYLVGNMRPALLATLTAMGLILLIACANVAALMLGQVEGRSAELALRSALGANRGRLTQQLVVEALLLGLAAGIAGAVIAAAAFQLLAHALPLGAWGESASLDWGTFAFAIALAIVASLLVVMVPTSSLWRSDLRGVLSSARTGGIHGRGGRLERGLVIAEVTLAMLIASGAALLVRSVNNLYAIDPGFRTENLAVLDVVMGTDLPRARRQQTLAELTASLAQLPGVERVAATHKIPLRGPGSNTGMLVRGREGEEVTTTFFRIVTPGYLEAMGLKLKAGRTYTEADLTADTTAYTIVINEALAKKYFPGENPLGRVIATGFGGWAQVIGIVGDATEGDLTTEREPARYNLYTQVPWTSQAQTLVIRTRTDPVAVLDAARRRVQQVAPGVAVQEATTMSRVFDVAVGPARQVMSLLTLLSALALVLGAVGIYGVIAHFAARRKRDWAIRVALGLPGRKVVTHIVGQGAALVMVGVALGAVGTVLLARLLATFLFGVSTVDPLSFAAASLARLLIGVGAAFVPARRAGMTDPALVLREQ
jgi:predicted permease